MLHQLTQLFPVLQPTKLLQQKYQRMHSCTIKPHLTLYIIQQPKQQLFPISLPPDGPSPNPTLVPNLNRLITLGMMSTGTLRPTTTTTCSMPPVQIQAAHSSTPSLLSPFPVQMGTGMRMTQTWIMNICC